MIRWSSAVSLDWHCRNWEAANHHASSVGYVATATMIEFCIITVSEDYQAKLYEQSDKILPVNVLLVMYFNDNLNLTSNHDPYKMASD